MNGAFAMRLAGARVRAALASTVTISLAAIESGAPEDTDVGGVSVATGITTYQILLTDDAGGQFKLVNNRLKAGATPTNGAIDPSPTVSGVVIFDNQIRVAWSAEVEVLGGISVIPGVNIYPSAAWTGVAGSGYTAANGYAAGAPSSALPTRTTAKPAINQLFFSRERFVADFPLSVRCGALGGVEKVIVHCEGNRFEATAETIRLLTDPRGGADWRMAGHHFVIDHAACGTSANPSGNGDLNIYFEAVPNDPTMQHRVLGPVTFYRHTNQWDYDLTVDPDQPAAGTRFQTVAAALNYLAARSDANNNRITTLKTTPFCDLARTGSLVAIRKGKTRIQAAPGTTLTIARPDLAANVAATSMNPLFDGLELYRDQSTGELVVDGKNILTIPRGNWGPVCKGIKYTNSAGEFPLQQKAYNDKTVLDRAGFINCHIEFSSAGLQANTTLYSTIQNCSGDLSTNAATFIGNRISGNSTFGYREDLNAFTAQYPAGGGTIIIVRASGENGPALSIRLIDPNGDTGAVAVSTSPAGAMYYMSQVVAWINSRAGWSAALTPQVGKSQSGDGRHAGAMKAVNTSATTAVQVLSRIAPHADYRQIEQGALSNAVIADNVCYDNSWATYQIARSTGLEDVVFINEAHRRNNDETSLTSQMSRNLSHVVFIHCTHINQGVLLRAVDNYNPGSYSGFVNCVFSSMTWFGSGTRRPPILQGNHFISAALAEDTTSTTGGPESSLFVDAVNGDFTPAADLLSNLVTPAAKYDAYGNLRAATDAKGAVRVPA